MAKMAKPRYFNDFNRLAKLANQQMRRMEKQDINSPAYRAVQAELEMIGVKRSSAQGRRFPEKKKLSYNEYEAYKAALERYMNAKTYTKKGALESIDRAWNTGNERYHLSDAGISKEDYYKFWASLPSKGRQYGSDVYLMILESYTKKNGSISEDNALTVEEIARTIENSKDVSSALESLGLSYDEFQSAEDLNWEDI